MTENEDLLARIGQLAGKVLDLRFVSSPLTSDQARSIDTRARVLNQVSKLPTSPSTCRVMFLRVKDGLPIREAEDAVVELHTGIAHSF